MNLNHKNMKKVDADFNILIVEFYTWHDECLYTTCQLLRNSGAKVTLALNNDLKTRTEGVFEGIADDIFYYPFRQGIQGIISLFKLHQLIRHKGFTHIFLNTASGSETWKFCLFSIPRKTKVIGTMHNIVKLTNSIGQKIVSHKLHGYILLSDILLERYCQVCTKPVVSVYPILYPKVKTIILPKPQDEVWITIPGAVSLSRRDYLSLLAPHIKYAPHVKFIILGNKNKADGKLVYEKVLQAGLQDNFIFFDKFVPEEDFYSYVTQSDYIMPLVHPCHKEYGKYLTEKISGTYNLAIAYRKPMLCPKEMESYEDFQDTSIFYHMEELQSSINSLSPISDSHLFRLPKWEKEVQQARLADFLKELG